MSVVGQGIVSSFRRFRRAAWWVHVLGTLAVVLAVQVVIVGVLAALYLDFVREHGPIGSEIPSQTSPSAEQAAELARRFAPILRYDSRELFVPIPQPAYVSRTRLKEEKGKSIRDVNPAPTVEDLPEEQGSCLLSAGCHYLLDVRGVEPDPPKPSQRAYDAIENQLLRTGTRPTVYAHVTQYDDTGEYAVQYWFLYFFNFRLNEHESDWEQITFRLDADMNPVDAFYSEHEGGATHGWAAIEKDGDHPTNYPALGSHANYFEPGRHPVEVGCRRVIGSVRQCFRGRRLLADVADNGGTVLKPEGYELSELAGPIYIGSYGSGNYVALTRQPAILSDPRTRTAWRDPLRPLR